MRDVTRIPRRSFFVLSSNTNYPKSVAFLYTVALATCEQVLLFGLSCDFRPTELE